jgi:hypothetical protein
MSFKVNNNDDYIDTISSKKLRANKHLKMLQIELEYFEKRSKITIHQSWDYDSIYTPPIILKISFSSFNSSSLSYFAFPSTTLLSYNI